MTSNKYKSIIKYNPIKLYLEQLFNISRNIKKTNGKNQLYIISDIIYSTLKYGSSPSNYFKFKFYDLELCKRSTYVTHKVSQKMIRKYNDNNYREIFEDKTRFAEKFKEYFGREWISLEGLEIHDFMKFIQGKEKLIYKPINSAQGQGIKKIETKNFKNNKQIYKYLVETYGQNGIVEEWIIQHEEVSKLYEKSVNPVRIITVNKSKKCNILVANLTIGNGRDISNGSCNDLVSLIDINTGKLKSLAGNVEGEYFDKHPITNEAIKGIKIPYWKEIKELVEEASSVVSKVGYVGWDIAITPEGPILIEGNTSPGYKFYQLPEQLPDKIGNRTIYEKFL